MSAAVKRRFIRQNREIARVNSTQSLRIRNLEAEISRLLAENISLREQAINSAQEAERWRSSHKLITEVGHLKDKLESRLSEVNALVSELGSLPEKAARRSSYRRRSGIPEPVKSPDQKDWQNRQTIGGVLVGQREPQEGRLPPIHEDKYYPRRTLEGHEIQRLVEDDAEASESPDLGPPPVAHFDVPDPIKFEPHRPLAGIGSSPVDEEQVMVNSTNLETRRKRRVSSLLQKAADLPDLLGNAAIEVQASDNSLNPGSKRKLSAREEDDHVKAAPKSSDDFSFQRRPATSSTPLSRANSSRFTRPPSKQPAQPANEQSLPSPQKKDEPVRKVLAPKSTNSPTKVRRVNVNDKSAALSEDGAKSATSRATRQDRRQSIAPLQGPAPRDDPPEDQVNDLPPKTPAGLEIFSPTSTEPSVKSNAHPTEMAVTASVEDVLGNAGRASRRARAAVSYAEPNLRDKMRRPGKELVTAVEGIDHFKNREASIRADSVDRQTDDGVKKEQLGDDAAWKGLPQAKDEPPSPLSNKVARLSGDMKDAENIAERRMADPSSINTSVSKLSIYDGPDSSPQDGFKANNSSTTETEAGPTEQKKSTLKSRRHSVNSTGLSRSGQDPASSHKESTERQPRPSSAAGHRIEGTSSRPGSATGHRAEGQRPGSAADLRRSASIANENSKPSTAATDLKRSTSATALNDGSGHMDRTASRRRSMMV
jgi:Shugoshin N-terminal coiled-coil region/Shugoshin C terminus